jgi:hypothetical protein
MTQNEIQAKLRAALDEGVTKEKDVVYILCQARKLVDAPQDGRHFALRLYCHWALHVDLMDRTHTLPFLSRVDSFLEHERNRDDMNVTEQHLMFREFVFLDTFRSELREFLVRYDLPTQICDEDLCWHNFLTVYAGVIENGSLYCGTEGLKLVKGVKFSKGGRTAPDGYFPFHLKWTILLQEDGKEIELEVNAAPMPHGGDMIIHSMKLPA